MRKLYFLFLLLGAIAIQDLSAQTTICTNHTNNNGNGSIIFNVQNTNSFGIVIQEIDAIMFGGTAGTYTFQLLQNTTPVTNQFGTWTLGTVGAGQNGWTQVGSSTVTLAAQTVPVPVITGLNIVVPANSTYSFGLSANGTIGYQTLTAGAGVNNFSSGGVNLQTGDGISWGGTAYPSTPTNYPRGWLGCIVFVPAIPCSAPSAQPTSLNLTTISITQINGSFTAASGAPTNYLVVRYPSGAAVTNPTNGVTYSVGSSLGLGTVISNNSSTTFSATGLTPATTYDFYVYSMNGGASCYPNVYLTTSPLFGSQATSACGGLAGGTYTVGPSGTYTTLTAAIAATSAGITGPVIFELQNTYTSAGETYPITFPVNPCITPTNTLTIRPQAGAAGLSITSANTTATIDFNGATYVTVDGRPGGTGTTSQLSISNTSTTGVAIRFINDAQNNTVTYCDVKGQNTTSPTTATVTSAGVIYFSTGTTNGNDNNTISNCSVHGTGAGTVPTVGIFAIGSTTTNAIYNDNCTITNCNIYDFFNAAAASTGIKIDAGNSAWTISNNSFYQTGSITYTTAATHRAIWLTPNTANLTPVASGFIVTGNFIGGNSPNAGGTPYTMLGAIANVFLGMDISVGLGAATSVQNNTVANIAFTTTSVANPNFAGISVANGNVSIGNTTGNVIGSGTGTGSITINQTTSSGGTVYGIRLSGGTGTTMIANNNTVGSFTINGSATTISDNFIGIGAVGGTTTTVTINSNTVGSTSTANSINQTSNGTSAVALTGIAVTAGATTVNVNNNLVANMNSNCTSTGVTKGINVSLGVITMNGNTVRNLSTQSTSVSTGSGCAIVGIAMTSVSAGHIISGNTIHSLSLTSASTGIAIQITGLAYAGTTTGTNTITKNFIHSFDVTASNNSSIITGLDIIGGTSTFANNMIRLGVKPDGSSLTTALIVRGITIGTTAANNIYFNSVYIGGTGVGTNTINSYAFNRSATSGAHDVRNNIFVNARSNATTGGTHFAINLANPNTGFAPNYNVYYTPGTGGVFAFNGTSNVSTYSAAWIIGDNNSVQANPQYINPTGTSSTVDLHIHPSNPTPVEGVGIAIASVTDDFDGQTRASFTPVDIGADAGNFVYGDLAPPVITYTPLASGCTTGDRTITATLVDPSAVPTSGSFVPRIYYKKNAGAYFSQPGSFVSGTGTNGTWSFTIVVADMGGVAAGDVVSYYIIAQDLATPFNIGSNPGGVVATDVNTITTHPTTPNSYAIGVTTGTFTVGAGGNFTTLTAAVNSYNAGCITGPVIFNLTDATYPSESFPIIINAVAGSSATNTLTIRPASAVTSTISGSVASGAIIRLNGADYITIDGSNNATTSRNLTITNTNTTAPTTIALISLGTAAGATNNTIKNCNISTGVATTIGYGIAVGGATPGTSGADNDNVTLQNNAITAAPIAIYANGTASVSAGGNDNLSILGNSIDYNATLATIGIEVGNSLNSSVSQNTVSEQTSTFQAPTGISLETGFVSSSVTKNNITKALTTNTGGYGGRGITVGTGTATSNLTIANNMISGVNGSNYTSFSNSSAIGIGIGIIGNSGTLTTTTGGVNLYFNSVNMAGTYSYSAATITAGLYIGSGASALDIRNNIIVNSLSNTSNATAKNYSIYSAAANTAFSNINYNDYYVSGTQGVLGFLTADQTTLTAVQTAFGGNTNSQNTSPAFVSASDLHIPAGTTTSLESQGTFIAGITTDIDGDTRPGPAGSVNGGAVFPDLGADEFDGIPTVTFCSGTPTAGTISGPNIICSGTPLILNLTGASATFGVVYQWRSSTTAGGPYTDIAGATSTTLNTTISTPTYFVVVVKCAANNQSAQTSEFAVAVNPTPTATLNVAGPITLCAPQTQVLSVTTNASSPTYQWQSSGSSISGATSSSYTVTSSGNYSVIVTESSTGCATTSASVAITVNPIVNLTLNPTSVSICTGSSSVLTAQASGSLTTNYSVSSITFATIPTPGSGVTTLANAGVAVTPLTNNNLDDGDWENRNLPFSFTFYGTTYTSFAVSTNGFIYLGAGAANTWTGYSNAFPSTAAAHPSIGAIYSDLDFRTLGTINYFTSGSAPNRKFVINWSGGQFYSGTGSVTAQVILNEGTNVIEVHITNSTGTNLAVEGIQNAAGTSAVTVAGRNASNWTVTTSDAYRWSPSGGTITYSWTPSTGLSATNVAAVTANPTVSRTYTVKATETTTGCNNFASATVLVDQVPSPVIAPSSATICNGQVQQLTVTSNNTAASCVTSSGAISVAVPDNNPAGAIHTINVSCVPAGAIISNIAVTFNMNHTFDGDMIFNVKAPNGNILNLVNQRGGSGDNFVNTSLASHTGLTAVGSAASPFLGTFSPDGVLGVGPTGYASNVINFTGLFSVPNGNWTLAMQDAANGDLGTLTSWSIIIYYYIPDNTVWSPTTALFTNAGATTPYSGTNLGTVYAEPSTTQTYTVTASTPGGCINTANVTITVNQLPAITSQPGNQSLCPGQTATFTVAATGTGISYQWYLNGNPLSNGGNISGATGTTLTVSNVTPADAGNYTVVVSGVCTPAATSNVATLAVGAPPIITSQPQSQTACSGNTVSFNVASSSSNLTYQWYHGATLLVTDGIHIFGATTSTLTITNITAADAGNYSVVVTNACSQSTTSATAVLTFSTNDRWLGTANSDWNNPNNWCNGVPTPTTDVEIVSGTPFPAILSANGDTRNLQINSGATLTVIASGWLNIWGSTLTQNGTFTTTLGTLSFRNTANLNVPAIIAANVVMNGAGGITLTGNMRVDSALTLTSGNITIGANNLTMKGGTLGSVASHIITNGTGAVTNNNVGVATVVFPVAPNATSYNPVQIASGGGLNYTVRVAVGINPAITNSAIAINRVWTITPSAAPSSAVQLTFGYADADGNAGYSAANRMEAGYYSGTAWTITTGNGGTAAMGTAAARLVYTTSQNFGTGAWVVANVGGLTGIVTGTPNLNSDIYSAKLLPNLVDNQAILRVMSRRAMNIEWMITDIQGRVVMKFNKSILAGQNDINLKLGHLASGTYQVVGYTDKGTTNVIPFVRL
jgi:subtilisin-like proprotein convertase family protein